MSGIVDHNWSKSIYFKDPKRHSFGVLLPDTRIQRQRRANAGPLQDFGQSASRSGCVAYFRDQSVPGARCLEFASRARALLRSGTSRAYRSVQVRNDCRAGFRCNREGDHPMPDVTYYQKRREALKSSYLAVARPRSRPALQTAGVDHLALICSELERTIGFYAEVLGMRLTQIVQNRDEPTSTHIFFDMGGGNQLAFFDFPEKGRGAHRARRWQHASRRAQGATGADARHHRPARRTSHPILDAWDDGRRFNLRARPR